VGGPHAGAVPREMAQNLAGTGEGPTQYECEGPSW
jgi:hypothetical protein